MVHHEAHRSVHERTDDEGVHEAGVVGDHQRGAITRERLETAGVHAVHHAHQAPHEQVQDVARVEHQRENGDDDLHEAELDEERSERGPGGETQRGVGGANHHERGVGDVVGGDHT